MAKQRGTGHNEPALEFLVIGRPNDTKDEDYRRQVRSHASRVQHHAHRETQNEQRSLKFVLVNQRAAQVYRPNRSRDAKKQSVRRQRTGLVDDIKPAPAGVDRPSRCLCAACHKDISDTDNTVSRRRTCSALVIPSNAVGRSFHNGAAAFKAMLPHDPKNCVGRALSALQMSALSVLNTHQIMINTQSKDFDAKFAGTGMQLVPGASSARYSATLYTEPVLLTATILITIGYIMMSRSGGLLQKMDSFHLLRLRGFLIKSIHAALLDPKRCVSNQLLATVQIFAGIETLRGDIPSYHAHMEGFVQMVNIRGGLTEIGKQDPYAERFFLWHDSNASAIVGCQPYCLRVDKPSLLPLPEPDAEMFLMMDTASSKSIAAAGA